MMKKSIFAVAVASALTFTAAQAETVLYGSIRYDYQNAKQNTLIAEKGYGFNADGKFGPQTQYRFINKRLSSLEDAGSRIGVRGSEDLGNGTAVIYQLEWGFDGMDSEASGFNNRLAYMGLTGDWGTFTAGRQDNPFKVTIVDDTVADDFNGANVQSTGVQRAMTSAIAGLELATATSLLDQNGQPIINPETTTVSHHGNDILSINDATFSRLGKVAAYTTPDFAGFQANIAIMMDEKLYKELPYNVGSFSHYNQQKTVDLWTVNAKYAYDLGNNAQILAKAGYLNSKLADNNASKMWGLYIGYLSDAFNVTASYANGNHTPQGGIASTFTNFPTTGKTTTVFTDGIKNKYQGWDIGASYSFGPNYFSTIRATYGQNQIKQNASGNYLLDNYNAGGKDKVKSWAIGFEQKLSTRTRVWAEYGAENTTYSQANIAKKKDNVISVGMRHDF